MKFLRDNGLTIALAAAFLISIAGMAITGWAEHNQELADHAQPALGFLSYLHDGSFISAVFENWESEFLQMSAYVMLTAFLFQRGSAESRDPDDDSPDEKPGRPRRSFLYRYSLGIALTALFILSFAVHFYGSFQAAVDEAHRHQALAPELTAYAADPRFWFESFQNWQSEFLSTAVLVVLSIFLRFEGSPESKKVGDPHSKTGK